MRRRAALPDLSTDIVFLAEAFIKYDFRGLLTPAESLPHSLSS